MFSLVVLGWCISVVLGGGVQVLTESNFDDIVLDASKDVLVEFYAPWCGHCKEFEPVFKGVADSFKKEKHILLAKVDAVKEEKLGKRFNITDLHSLPEMKFFSKGHKDGEKYSGKFDGEDVIDFLNEKCGTKVGGGKQDWVSKVKESIDKMNNVLTESNEHYENQQLGLDDSEDPDDEQYDEYAKYCNNRIAQ